jgi:hypothetical protein
MRLRHLGLTPGRQDATKHLLIGLLPVSQSVHCLTNPAAFRSFPAQQALLEALTCWSSRPLITAFTLPLLTVPPMTSCLSSRTMQLAAASPAACSSRTAPPAAAGRRALPASLPAAAARPSTCLQAIAGAREAAVQAAKDQRPRPQPAVEVFPATSTSRMLNDNRGFVESHRCAPCLCPGCLGLSRCLVGSRLPQRSPYLTAARRLAAPAAGRPLACWPPDLKTPQKP